MKFIKFINMEISKNNKFLKGFVASFALAVSGFANAGLVERNFQTAGDGLLTYDDVTGYEWLDLSLNIGRNYNSVAADLQTGGAYEGFRYATRSEYETLWAGTSYDHVNWYSATYAGDVDEVQRAALIGELLGYTFDTVKLGQCILSNASYCYRENMGILSDIDSRTGYHWLTHMDFVDSLLDSNSNVGGVSYWYTGYGKPDFVEGSDSYFDQRVSSWLVRDHVEVPEPSTLAIFALGMIGFASRRSKKQS